MSVTNRKLFNRGARDELRRKGGIMASSEPMMQAVGYENGGQITREDILRFLAQGPVSGNPSGARKTLDTLLYPARYSGQRQSGYTYNDPPGIDSPMTVTTVGPRGVMSQADPEKYYRGLVRDGVQEGSQLSNLLGTPDPGEVGSLTGRFKDVPLSEIIDSSAYSSLFGKEGSAARYLAQKAGGFLESDTSVPREQIYGEDPQVTGSDTAFETISSEPPSYLYVNIPGVTTNPVLMTERDFERFEKMYPDAARSSESTVIDVESLDSRVDISNIPIVTSLDSTSGSRKDAVEKTKKTTTSSALPVRGSDTRSSQQLAELLAERRSDLPGVNLPGSSETYEIDPNAALAAGQAITESENINTSTETELEERLRKEREDYNKILEERGPEDTNEGNLSKLVDQVLIRPPVEKFIESFSTESEAKANSPKLTNRPDALDLEGTSAPDKPKFPTLDQFIEVQGGKDKREVQTNADEILVPAINDFKEVKTGDAFDDVFDKYVSRFSEILGDDEEEKKKNTGFALAMYGATYAATGDAGQAAMTMIETLRGDAATRQKRTDQIKMLALQAATDKESRDDALQLQLNKETRQDKRELEKYEAKLEIKATYDDPTGYLDTKNGKFFSEIYADVLTDDTLNEDEKGEAFITRAGEANAEAFYRALGIPRFGVKQGGGKGSDWFNQ